MMPGDIKKYAVLLIDMQACFLKDIPLEDREKVIDSQKRVLDYCVEKGIPVVVLEYASNENCKKGPTIGLLKEKVMVFPENKRATIIKENNDGFYSTSLEEVLNGLGVNHVCLMGINSTSCVQATGLGALARRFKISSSPSLITEPRSWGEKRYYPWFLNRCVSFPKDLEDLLVELSSQGSYCLLKNSAVV